MVWRKPLSKDIQNYLLSLSDDVLETEQMFSSERKVAFIRVENDEALIYGRRFGWRTFWPYVAYVDLTRSKCFLEFRASITMHFFLLTFLSSGTMTAFIIFMMGLNYYMETGEILRESIKRPVWFSFNNSNEKNLYEFLEFNNL